MNVRFFWTLLIMFGAVPAFASAPLAVSEIPVPGGFALAADGTSALVQYDPADHPVVAHAATDLSNDLTAVTGIRSQLNGQASSPAARQVVLIGTLGRNRIIDNLVKRGRLNVHELRGAWESFLIATVQNPLPGIRSALIIVGSDRRGTAYGVYELSEAIGVSPWTWWADVPAQQRKALWLAPGTRHFGSPSVKYRGIFINDEDWGLHPWAARTYEPETGGIGPKTYERVFELLLRLKANTLWPAMHRVSPPFNSNPANAKLADEYAIIMGSSHAEPMLRNNVGEWQDEPERFNYATNRDGVQAYWEERVRSNAPYENLWTVGMRGIHDSGMVGASAAPEKIALLERVIADQRSMLARHVGADLSRIPQMFMPYKEVLELYRAGLRIPGDVTIVWPDDNFGYIRQFPNDAERKRPGGSGIYYHLSYLGAPLAYLWLSTTPPALIQEEMTRAWDAGARTLWIANVGDIKPAEIGISLFLEMAWNIDRWRDRGQHKFLADWARRTFGSRQAQEIGAILDIHFSLNSERRPEHLQWWLPGERPRRSLLSERQIASRLSRFDELTAALDRIAPDVPPQQADAFFQLVSYPIRAAADANRRYFSAERYARLIDTHPTEARAAAGSAAEADARIKALTRRFNEEIAGGKWRYIMAEEPADNLWPRFRLSPLSLPAPGLNGAALPMPAPASMPPDPCSVAAGQLPAGARGWRAYQGLGRGGRTLVATTAGAKLDLHITVPSGCRLALGLLPTFPTEGTAFTVRASVNDGPVSEAQIPREVETAPWAQGVLDNRLVVPLGVPIPPGSHRLTLSTEQPGLALDEVVLLPAASSSAAALH